MERIFDIILTVTMISAFIGWFIEYDLMYIISIVVMGIVGTIYFFKYVLLSNPSEKEDPKEEKGY